MSYSIIYDRIGIRCEKGVIPLFLHGCNNLYQNLSGRYYRSRNWGNDFRYREEDWLLTEQNIDSLIEYLKERGEASTDVKYKSRFINYIKMSKVFANIYKNAVAIEDFKSINLFVSICEYGTFSGKTYLISTTEQLNNLIEKALAERKWAFINTSKLEKPILKKETINKEGEFVIKYKKFFLTEDDSWVSVPDDVKIFVNWESAKKYCDAFFEGRENIKIVKLNADWLNPREYILTDGKGKYFLKKRRNGANVVYDKDYAKKLTYKQANDFIKKYPFFHFQIKKIAD